MKTPFLSYAQNGEDIILWRALGHIENGFFVDVGAAEPTYLSATYALYLRGWRGINIEPVKDFAEQLRKVRPDDLTLEVAVGARTEEVTAFVVPGTGLSTTNLQRGRQLESSEDNVETIKVPATTLTAVLNEHVPSATDIHFLKIDVEGSEEDVLRGLDFSTWRPWVLVIEATLPNTQDPSHEAWEPLVLEAGYEHCGFDGLNRYYVANEHRDLAPKLGYGPGEFDRPFEVVHLMSDLKREHAQLRADIDMVEAANRSMSAHVDHVSVLLAESQAETARFGKDIEDRVAHIHMLDNRIYELTGELHHLSGLLMESKAETTRLGEENENLVAVIHVFERRIEQLVDELETERNALQTQIDDANRLVREANVAKAEAARQLAQVYNSETWRTGRALWKTADKTGVSRVFKRPVERVLNRAFGEVPLVVPTPSVVEIPMLPPQSGAWDFPRSREWQGSLAAFADQLSYGRVPGPDSLVSLLTRLQLDHDLTLLSGRYSGVERRSLREIELAVAARSTGEVEPGLAIIDARCFDDHGLATRGIGRHAASVLRQLEPHLAQFDQVVLIAESAAAVREGVVRPQWQTASRSELHASGRVADLFVSLSPSTARVAPELVGGTTRMIGVAYDLIPLAFPRHYHADTAQLLDYVSTLIWLRTFDELWCISSGTASALEAAVGIDPSRIRVTNVESPLPITFSARESTSNTIDVLICGGGDARKNLLAPLHGLRQHPGSFQVEVLGFLGSDMSTDMHQAFIDVPGKSLVELGAVDDVQAAEAFARADVVVVPSHSEGYSLPVAEGITSGAVVVASDLAEHRELLGEGPWLVSPADHTGWAAAISGAAQHAASWHLAQRTAFEASTSQRFAASEAVIKPSLPRNWKTRARRPSLAIITPLPPQETGIADNSRFLFPALEKFYDVSYVVNDVSLVGPGCGPRRGATITTSLHGRFDHVLHVLGNSHFHIPALEHLERFGGAALCHDNRMTGVYLHWLGVDETAEIMSMSGKQVHPGEVNSYLVDIDSAPDMCFGRIAQQSQPLIVHSQRLARRIERETSKPVDSLPFCPLRVPTDDELLRRRSRHRVGRRIIGTFGELSLVFKRHDLVLEMLAWHRDWGLDSELVIVGGGSASEVSWVLDRAEEWNVADRVTVTGRVDDTEYRRWLTVVDLNIQVRNSPRLTISGPAIDSVVFGVPLITTESMAEELVGAPLVKTVPNAFSSYQLARAAQDVIEEDPIEVGDDARIAFIDSRSPERYAELLAALLERQPR